MGVNLVNLVSSTKEYDVIIIDLFLPKKSAKHWALETSFLGDFLHLCKTQLPKRQQSKCKTQHIL